MRQLLELSPTNLPIDDILGQFQGLTELSLPDLGSFAADLPVPDLGLLTQVVGQFGDMAGKLSEGPEALASGLLEHLQVLGSGSLDIGNLIGPLAEMTGSIGALPTALPAFFEHCNNGILPVLHLLQQQE